MAGLLIVPAAIELLTDSFSRVDEGVQSLLDGLDADDLARRAAPGSNTIAWLVWHLLRVQDDHVADVAGTEQAWTAGGWFERSGLPFDAAATGYGQSTDDVDAVQVSAELLAGYSDAVHRATRDFLQGLHDDDLARVVDEGWDPPVTLAARLVSVIGDDLKHLGQAELLAGLD